MPNPQIHHALAEPLASTTSTTSASGSLFGSQTHPDSVLSYESIFVKGDEIFKKLDDKHKEKLMELRERIALDYTDKSGKITKEAFNIIEEKIQSKDLVYIIDMFHNMLIGCLDKAKSDFMKASHTYKNLPNLKEDKYPTENPAFKSVVTAAKTLNNFLQTKLNDLTQSKEFRSNFKRYEALYRNRFKEISILLGFIKTYEPKPSGVSNKLEIGSHPLFDQSTGRFYNTFRKDADADDNARMLSVLLAMIDDHSLAKTPEDITHYLTELLAKLSVRNHPNCLFFASLNLRFGRELAHSLKDKKNLDNELLDNLESELEQCRQDKGDNAIDAEKAIEVLKNFISQSQENNNQPTTGLHVR